MSQSHRQKENKRFVSHIEAWATSSGFAETEEQAKAIAESLLDHIDQFVPDNLIVEITVTEEDQDAASWKENSWQILGTGVVWKAQSLAEGLRDAHVLGAKYYRLSKWKAGELRLIKELGRFEE